MLEAIKKDFNLYLESLYTNDEVNEMISYSLVNEGKRLRPMFLFAILLGFNYSPNKYFDIASSIEMVHTYSLVHDDLPAMDNDDYRHGKLTSHKKYGDANAILVGDALLSDSFGYIINNKLLNDSQKILLVNELVYAIGSKGMVRGQFYDLANNKETNIKIDEINYLKTTKLLSVPFNFSLIITNKMEYKKLFEEISNNIGLAFQIQDDILDYEGSLEELGKTPLKDASSNKNTYVNRYGIIESKNKVNELFNKTYKLINSINGFNPKYLIELIKKIENRRK